VNQEGLGQLVIGIGNMSSLQFFDTVDWVTVTTSGLTRPLYYGSVYQ